MRTGLHDDLTELLGGNQPALRIDLHLKIDRLLNRLLAYRASRNLNVLLADGVDNVAGRQVL